MIRTAGTCVLALLLLPTAARAAKPTCPVRKADKAQQAAGHLTS